MDFSCRLLRESERSQVIWSWLKSILFLIDAEKAHQYVIFAVRILNRSRLGKTALQIVSGSDASDSQNLKSVTGIQFRSPLGLAAGFDKNAEILTALPHLGFGFAEIGTVTPLPQAGNPRPRLFRDPSRESLFNRMGFNGDGAEIIARRVAKAKNFLPEDFRVGINIGKNKDTPLESAATDYIAAVRPFRDLGDYIAVNVSSPNTPGLRSLQSLAALKPIIEGVNEEISGWKRRPPLFLKLAPEVLGDQLSEILSSAEKWGVNGWILTNTLAGEWSKEVESPLSGGWSGRILCDQSRNVLKQARLETKLPIISVGGIMSVEEAQMRLKDGADLIQIYSGWVFAGPSFPARINRQIR